MQDTKAPNRPTRGSAAAPPPDPKVAHEQQCDTVSSEHPGAFKNDPDDPTNPNEVIERSRRQLRPSPLPPPSGEGESTDGKK